MPLLLRNPFFKTPSGPDATKKSIPISVSPGKSVQLPACSDLLNMVDGTVVHDDDCSHVWD